MGMALVAAGAYLLVVALFSKGTLGLVRVIGPRLHQALDLLLVVGLVLSPVFARRNLDFVGVIIAEAAAIVLLRLATRTRYVAAPAGAAPARSAPPPTRAAEPQPTTPGGGGVRAASRPAKPKKDRRDVPTTAWTLGVLTARARRRGVGPERALGNGARRLGAAFGRANRGRSG